MELVFYYSLYQGIQDQKVGNSIMLWTMLLTKTSHRICEFQIPDITEDINSLCHLGLRGVSR